jgi:hypothetical protein
MKDFNERIMRNVRPNLPANRVVKYCLDRLFLDQEHKTSDEIVSGLTFEEIIGALLMAEDAVLVAEDAIKKT